MNDNLKAERNNIMHIGRKCYDSEGPLASTYKKTDGQGVGLGRQPTLAHRTLALIPSRKVKDR